MRFRPCIDIHDGKVKQIVGGTLSDEQGADTNYVSEYGADYFGRLYRTCNVPGGHIILLNKAGTKEYMEDIRAAAEAMKEYPGGFMIGGGVTTDNAQEYLKLGASHVIVTSYVFRDGLIDYDRLEELVNEIGKEHLVLDLSCRKRQNSDGSYGYYIVTDRWQNYTDTELSHSTLDMLSKYCDEYLIHAVDVEGKRCGVDQELLKLLGQWSGTLPITYAGGVSSFEDMDLISELGQGKVDVTIGSALSIFGGDMDFNEVVNYSK
ncbi:1-(5-phosphoribosyl)-5-[(5-phosphoribosylamino)methylideneamino] imidazole-4-carboxamide isomerase [Lachnospiraceae bacterium NE2001]|nr:1-(5-phosphoribosyl)-5-[(5-phosphoribosylamino)methylideneamino] imidazole-4-carboxamide isomerase [Lachnospiraceae bacterium NE2001]